MTKVHAMIAGGLAVALAGALTAMLNFALPVNAQSETPVWEAVKAEVPVGKSVRLEIRLIGAGANPVMSGVTVTSTRLDMGPDGMATMTAPLRPVSSAMPGIIAFETDLVMAGRWALTVSAKVEGQPKPVTGKVIFTAVEKRSESPSPANGTVSERKIVYYRNPMGLPDVSPVPKKDPMGMDYIPVHADEVSGRPGTVRIDPDKVQRAGVRIETVGRRNLARTVRAVGNIVSDESRLAVFTVRFNGFIEELLVPLTGTDVRAGQPLVRVWIESPEILQKQADFLTSLRGRTDRQGDTERAEQNLRLFGIPDQALEQLRRRGQPIRSIVLMAPTQGTVIDKPAVVGMRFAAGDTLFKIADHSRVWVMAQVAERDLAHVRVGQTGRVTFRALPGLALEGPVAFIYPELDKTTRSALLRIELPNPDGRLHIGLYADVAIGAGVSDDPVLAVPEAAVIDSGTRQVAFVAKGDGLFEPRDLNLGRRGHGFVEVREGLAEGERIVASGNFLIDAESNLRAALATFAAPKTQP